MYRLAVCDDEPRELDKITSMLDAYGQLHTEYEFSIQCFTTVEALLLENELQNGYDLLLSDIYMPQKSGIEMARELRRNGFSYPIIFFTSSSDHALEAYGVFAIQYLVKPVTQPDFFTAMDIAFQHMNQARRRYIALKTDNELRRVAIGEIIYCEAQRNYQRIYLNDNSDLRVRMTSSELFTMLSAFPDFTRCGASYILNLNHVLGITAKDVHMDNHKSISVPRGTYAALRERYFDFYCNK